MPDLFSWVVDVPSPLASVRLFEAAQCRFELINRTLAELYQLFDSQMSSIGRSTEYGAGGNRWRPGLVIV